MKPTKKAVTPKKASPRVRTAAAQSTMTIDDLYRIGESLFGTHWQADLAKDFQEIDFDCTKSLISKIIHGSRKVPPGMGLALREIVLSHIMVLTECLELPGIAKADDEHTKKAAAAIRKGVEIADQA